MSFTLERAIPSFLVFALLILALIGGATYRSLISMQQALEWEAHTRDVQLHLEKMQAALMEAETSARGYVLIGRDDFPQSFDKGASLFRTQLQQLLNLTADKPAQQQRLTAIQRLGEQKLAFMQKLIEIRRTEGVERATEEVNAGIGVSLMNQIRPLVSELQQEEVFLLDMRKADLQTRVNRTIFIILTGSILGILSLAIANFVIVRQLTRRRQAELALAQANVQLEKRVEEQSKNLSKTSDELSLENIRRALAEKNERDQREWWRITLNSIGLFGFIGKPLRPKERTRIFVVFFKRISEEYFKPFLLFEGITRFTQQQIQTAK